MEVEMDFDGENVCYKHIIDVQSTETSNYYITISIQGF